MKAVILAAGKSTRTYPLTLTRPKPLLPILNKPILGHTLDQLVGIVKEVIIVVNYLKEQIIEYFGDEYKGIVIRYVEQKKPLGTGDAILSVKPHLDGRFMVLNGDDIFHHDDLKKMVSHNYAILAREVENPRDFGILEVDGNKILSIIEKPKDPPSNFASVGVYILDSKIFEHELVESPRGEYEITDYIDYLLKTDTVNFETVEKHYFPIGYPWQVLNASEALIKNISESKVEGTVEEGATLKGDVIVGKGTFIKAGSYIEGPVIIGENCDIGPNCYIRAGTVLGDNCKVGNGCEIKNTIFFNNTKCGHLSYFGDSILGEKVNIGAGTIVGNLRHDNKNIKSDVKGILVDTGRRKFGTVISDGVHTGIHTSIYPGRKIYPNGSTRPNEDIQRDLMSDYK